MQITHCRLFNYIFFVLIFLFTSCNKNENFRIIEKKIFVLKFKFQPSKSTDQYEIFCKREKDSTNINVIYKNHDSEIYNKTFRTSNLIFDQVLEKVYKINIENFYFSKDKFILDGSNCEIEVGGNINSIVYRVWSPDDKTEERNLVSFLEACKLILNLVNLDSKIIFHN